MRLPLSAEALAMNMMMISFITRGGEGRGDTSKESKATKSEGRCLEEGASRALMRQVVEEGCGGRGLGGRDDGRACCGQRGEGEKGQKVGG